MYRKAFHLIPAFQIKSDFGKIIDRCFVWFSIAFEICAPMPQCNLLSKYLLPKCPDSEKKCLSSSSSVILYRRAHTKPVVWALCSRYCIMFTWWNSSCTLWRISPALSREPLYIVILWFFRWLESNSKTLQDVANTDAWAKVSQCVLRCKKGRLGRRKNAVFYYRRVNLTILNFVNCQLVWGLGGWVWGVLFISNI